MTATPSREHAAPGRGAALGGAARAARRHGGAGARRIGRHLEQTFGGSDRTRVIVVLAAVLALSSADAATVGAAAGPLREALHISNTDVGLLVTVSSLVAAAASVPFGILADRTRRTRVLAVSVAFWGVAMLWSAASPNFARLLESRLFLGIVTASAGPVVASLVGDYFPSAERGRIYSYILTGELLGAGFGFAVTGDVAAISWRAAFVLLAIPTVFLCRALWRLPEPVRGGRAPLRRPDDPALDAEAGPGGDPTLPIEPEVPAETDAQRIARERGIVADPRRTLKVDGRRLNILQAARYVLSVRTNVVLIVAGALVYYYQAGIETFGVEFAHKQYGLPTAVASLFLILVGLGAVTGVLLGGGLSDWLLGRGHLNSRLLISGVSALLTAVLFLPAVLTRGTLTAIPYLMLAALFLTGQNAPIDAARLDIVPPTLWGRAEGIRTLLRTSAQSIAPVAFGGLIDAFGGGRAGLETAFAVMLVPLAASGVILLLAMRVYPQDVATAAAAVPPRPGD